MRVLFTCLLGMGLLIPPQADAFFKHANHGHKKQHEQHHKHKHHQLYKAKKHKKRAMSRFRDQPFVRLTYSNGASFDKIDQPDGDLFNVTFGRYSGFSRGAGSFLHFGTSVIDLDKKDNFPGQTGRWYLLSAGLSLTPFYGLELYGGPGWGWSDTLAIECEECHYTKLEGGPKHNEVNFHVGATYRWHRQIGLSVEYDSAPNAVSVGFTFSGK